MAINRRDLFKWFGGSAVVAAVPAIAKEPLQKLTYFSDQGIEIFHPGPVIANAKGEFDNHNWLRGDQWTSEEMEKLKINMVVAYTVII